ncbi:immunoglobulin-like domain-containing protein [Colwellia piezophila]|uniref:immunoglobulin-like domain-containing protein n=1 Tax=Colwellia piezophila TaxID=211668 RepID=UPI0003628CF9|nr:immunoglobulin-like domain-containing protein [Colwellia piezophila]
MKYRDMLIMSSLFLTACGGGEESSPPEQAVDRTVPIITVIGSATVDIFQGQSYQEPGVTAFDDVDGDITSAIINNVSALDINTIGQYSIHYSVTDQAGNQASASRTVRVIAQGEIDSAAPLISLVGNNPQQLTLGEAYPELGATAVDERDGDMSNNIVIDASAVNSDSIGSYEVSYTVHDAAENSSVVTRVVNVVAAGLLDSSAAIISLLGVNPQQLTLGETYLELGATALDEVDGNLTNNIIIDSSALNNQLVGSYQVSYTVSDKTGNTAVTNRTINVAAANDTTPVLSLIGSNPQQLLQGQTYTELNATAFDQIEGDISDIITIDTSAVDMQTVGHYRVIYAVVDSAGHAVSVQREVQVIAPQLHTTALSDLSYVSSGAADFTDIALDSFDNAYIVFQDQSNANVTRIKKQVAGVWLNLGDNDGILSTQAASYQQVAIASDDTVYTAFIENNQVKLTRLVTNNWQSFTAPTITGNVDSLQFALDSQDVPYLLYGQASVFSLISYQNNQWQSVGSSSFNVGKVGADYVIDFVPSSSSSIALSYRNSDDANKAARTVVYDGNVWLATSGLGSGSSISLTSSSEGDFYAFKVWFSNTKGKAAVYKLMGTQWRVMGEQGFNHVLTEHGINEAGTPINTDIVVNDVGDIYVVYTDPQTIDAIAENRTVLAKYSAENWQQLMGSDITPIVQASTRSNSLTLTGEGNVFITFVDGGVNHSGKAVMLKELTLLDTDGDGIVDIVDLDDDNDGYNDIDDYKPLDASVWLVPFDLAAVLLNAQPGDVITIPAGSYSSGVTLPNNKPSGSSDEPILIVGETDAQGNNLVTFDGTVNVDDLAINEWQQVNGIWQRQLSATSNIWQLFIEQADSFSGSEYSQMVPARWPNAKFTDGSIYSRSVWAKATDTGHNPIMKHKDLAKFSYSGTMNALNQACFSRFADGEAGWEMDNIGSVQKQWLLAQSYSVDSKILQKCVGVTTDAQVSYQPAGQASLNHDLAQQAFDATGAMAILNYGHWRTWTRPVLTHTPGSNQFTHVFSPEYHGKNHYYYLEGALSLLDSEEEWYFDKNNHTIYFKTPDDVDPRDLNVRVKVQSYAVEMTKATNVTFKNLNFFATTIKCKSCSNFTIDNANFNYGGASKRMLKKWANAVNRSAVVKLIDVEPDNVYVSGINNYETETSDKYSSVSNAFINSTVTNTDSPALHLNGKDSIIRNNHFENVDYTCAEGWSHQAAVNTYMGFDTNFTYNTLINTACSQALRGRAGSDIRYNYIKNAGWAQTDGALLGGGHNMAAAYNWTMDHKEKGLRFDAAWPPTAISQWGTDSYAHHNVTIRNKGLVFKGWKQRIYNNTVVDLDYINPITQMPDGVVIPRLVIHNDTKKTQDSNDAGSDIALCVGDDIDAGGCGAGVATLYANNLSALILGNIGPRVYRNDSLATIGGPILATGSTNVETNANTTTNEVAAEYQNLVQKLLRDPNNYDFRPKLDSTSLIGTGSNIGNTDLFPKTVGYGDYDGLPSNVDYIGAYAASSNYYSIPGKRELKASHPIPLDNSLTVNSQITAKIDTDLIWRVARDDQGASIDYQLYFEGEFVGSYSQQQNIHSLADVTLVSGQSYQWRVDVVVDGIVHVGDSWQFIVE